jgi:hypothetical protein
LTAHTRIIWIAWLQGWSQAPFLVRQCLASWQLLNPGWQVRVLDLSQIRLYLDLPSLQHKSITAASFSDIARIALLHEFGGVWVDATVLCRKPLDEWLHPLMETGFFAFHRPGPDRPLSSWLLAANAPGHSIIAEWYEATCSYWRNRSSSHDYFWFHHLFDDLCQSSGAFRQMWDRVPKISADGPHRAQELGLDCGEDQALEQIRAEASPVLKLTHRHDPALLERDCLLSWLIKGLPAPLLPSTPASPASQPCDQPELAGLSVSTENLGDHIQILACNQLTQRLWDAPSIHIDRDHEIGSLPGQASDQRPMRLVINGWFKTNHAEWPPHPALLPAFVGFHLRPHQCPTLLSEEAIQYYRQHAPIGCRDAWTCQLLQERGVDAYLSHCLSLTLPRRTTAAVSPSEVFVVSRDTRICAFLPQDLGPYTFISHYSGTDRFQANMLLAAKRLELYRSRARLIITTLLHCALPAMAMGIPVIMVWPINTAEGRQSDRQRFSSLLQLIPIHEPEELAAQSAPTAPADCTAPKLTALDSFARATSRWGIPCRPYDWEPAPSSVLPPP